MAKKKTYKVVMEFEDEDLAKDFFAYMCDGGGEQSASWEDEDGMQYYMDFDYWGGQEKRGPNDKGGSTWLKNKKVIVTRTDCEFNP